MIKKVSKKYIHLKTWSCFYIEYTYLCINKHQPYEHVVTLVTLLAFAGNQTIYILLKYMLS